jgi:threonine dehydrogenase-like Zn-dependent dehydrogenase
VLVRTTVSGIKSGTELNLVRGQVPFVAEIWDPVLRLFRQPEAAEQVEPFFPHGLGSWAAGVVVATGPWVTTLRPGDLVHGEWKHRQTAILSETRLYRVASPEQAEIMLFTDPAKFALAAVHDAEIKLGDRVAIFGMGAIGLLAVQMARLNGARQVFAVDPIEGRLQLALRLGADAALNPSACDVALTIKRSTDSRGVDVALEISGIYAALQEAIRCTCQAGRVVAASYYGAQEGRADLSREWHHNRITLRSSMPVWGCPHRHYPAWDHDRTERQAMDLLQSGAIEARPLIGDRVPFFEAGRAYAMIDQAPDEKVKILLAYPGAEG